MFFIAGLAAARGRKPSMLRMLLDMQISHLLTIQSGCSSFIKNPSLQGEH
jgi:hypothetical protein